MKRTALITGTAQGIGNGIAQYFYDRDYQVIGLDVQEQPDAPWPTYQLDLAQLVAISDADRKQLKENLTALWEPGDKLDVLINNAAYQVVKPMRELTPHDWQQTQNVNVAAPFFLTQLFEPELRAAGGSVVNISSIHRQLTKKQFTAYATSKGALSTLTHSLALELAPDVRVNGVAPAAISTQMLRDGFADQPEQLEQLKAYHPVKKIGSPEDVARACAYLANPDNTFLSGTILELDGGISKQLSDPSK
ncbi:MAG: SDR family NAD(P)-dependent oxidoreductase [Bacteroidota bacterium]